MIKSKWLVVGGLVFLSFMTGCVPSNDVEEKPTYSLLSTFYTPLSNGVSYVWRHNSPSDTSVAIEQFDHTGQNLYPSIYPTATFFRCTDTSTQSITEKQSVIYDSVIVEYLHLGSSVNEVKRLYGVLKVGGAWTACARTVTSNGSKVQINALIDDYYTATQIAGKQYSDVYHVTYKVADVLSPFAPSEPEYQKGATSVIYFAKSIGPIFKITKDAYGNILFTDELIETRTL